MGKGMYLRLAAQNIKNNRRTYVPYMLTGIFTVMMFYNMNFLSLNDGISKMSGGADLEIILMLGVWVMGIFAAIFLFYTNSFLIKRRKKELGLYNILGMEKKHIGRVLCWETVIVTLTSLLLGNLMGVLGSKFLFLVLLKILQYPVPLGFDMSVTSILNTVKVFGIIYLLSFLNNLRQIHLSSPVQLLQGANVGEREPKTKWLLALVGMICLGVGYYIAVVTESPVDALMLFFVAVILVMLGTYCLFTAVSIVILKLLRNNKKFYYKTNHFTSVSGMIYRMKQNAVGLANICILSTAVLIMISGTVSLYAGREDILNSRYGTEVVVTAVNIDEENTDLLHTKVEEVLRKYQLESTDNREYHVAYKTLVDRGGRFTDVDADDSLVASADKLTSVSFISLEDYNRCTGQSQSLDPGQVLLFINTAEAYGKNTITIDEQNFEVKQELQELFTESKVDTPVQTSIYLVMENAAAVEEQAQMRDGKRLYYKNEFNLSGDENKFLDFETELNTELQSSLTVDFCNADGRAAKRESFVVVYGGFLFLGIFLGVVFLMATAMIIYYKQVSEGMDDRERFAIMQKVGMSRREVRSSIRSQVLTVFFLPLIMAMVHICFAFPMITKLLASFSMLNVKLFAICTLVTIAIFAVVYAIIYALTAKVYYKIVK